MKHHLQRPLRRLQRSVLAVAVLLLVLAPASRLNPPEASAQSTSVPPLEPINPMLSARSVFTTTLLNNGKILVVGGNGPGGQAIAQAELYDPATNTWTATGALGEARQQHSATLLPNGRVLIVGGVVNGDTATAKKTVEIYNPATGKFTPAASIRTARANHFAVLLRTGLVLIGGGYTVDGSSIRSAQLYNPASGVWTDAANVPWDAQQQTATLLNDNSVLVAGGDGMKNAALYFPATNTWQLVEEMFYGRAGNNAILLRDGRVLVVGLFAQQAEIYDPVKRTWSFSGDMRVSRLGEAASLLPNGQVLVSGGRTTWTGSVVDSTELYNPETNEWTDGPRMYQTRENHVSMVLPNNYLFIIGGEQNGAVYRTAERSGPIAGSDGCTASAVIMLENSSCRLALRFTTVNVSSSQFRVTATASDPSLIPASGLVFDGAGSDLHLTITPAKTNAVTSPTRQGKAVVTVTARDGVREETLPPFQVSVLPPPWLVMLYLNGDDGYCEGKNAPDLGSIAPAIKSLLQRLQVMEFNIAMRLAVLVDTHDSKCLAGEGDSRIYVRDPDGLTDVTTKLLTGGSGWPGFSRELNTADPTTVRSFVTWARQTYPNATYSFLSLVDHGGGWAPDLNRDAGQPRGIRLRQAGGWRGMSVDYTSGGTSMSTKDTHRALQGLGIDLVFFDACLMGMLESAYEIRNDADFLIAGENQLFAVFPYETYFAKKLLLKTTTPKRLAQDMVESYNTGVDFEKNPFAIAAIDLRQLRSGSPVNLPDRVETLAAAILSALPGGSAPIPESNPVLQALKLAYRDALKFDYDSSLTLDPNEGYVDLRSFVQQLKISTAVPPNVLDAARAVYDATTEADGYAILRVNPKDGAYYGVRMNFAQAGGLSIYLPLGEQDYRPTLVDPTKPECPAAPERQLAYYADPTQLALTQDKPTWSALLVRLEQTVPRRRAPVPDGCFSAQLSALNGLEVDTHPFRSPWQLPVAEPIKIYTPLVVRR